MTASLGRTALAFALLLACGACFPTFQSARVEPGFRVDAAVTALADQRRDNKPQGPDDIVALIPAYGFGRRFELGLPIALYADDGFRTGPPNYGKIVWLLMPYAKLALLGADSKDHLSVSAQTAYLLPANIGVRYGRDLGGWEPQVGASYIFSGGPSGDDPLVTRYQRADQSLRAGSIGATFNSRRRPAFEIGVLRNSYMPDPWIAPRVRQTLYDLFVGFRVSAVK